MSYKIFKFFSVPKLFNFCIISRWSRRIYYCFDRVVIVSAGAYAFAKISFSYLMCQAYLATSCLLQFRRWKKDVPVRSSLLKGTLYSPHWISIFGNSSYSSLVLGYSSYKLQVSMDLIPLCLAWTRSISILYRIRLIIFATIVGRKSLLLAGKLPRRVLHWYIWFSSSVLVVSLTKLNLLFWRIALQWPKSSSPAYSF